MRDYTVIDILVDGLEECRDRLLRSSDAYDDKNYAACIKQLLATSDELQAVKEEVLQVVCDLRARRGISTWAKKQDRR